MKNVMSEIEQLRARALEAVSKAGDEAGLEEVRVAYLGKKGEISLKLKELANVA